MSSRCHNSEGGYTLQTLIIIAILVLGATTASVILYAVLRDSTSRIAGGSETFDGYPSGPQNLRVESVPSGSDVEVTISWEAPSYLGEFPLTGYELSITENNSPKLEHNDSDWNCGETSGVAVLATINPNFSYDNSCVGTVTMVDNSADYELEFTVNLGSADARSSPGGLTFYREIDLTPKLPLQREIQTVSMPDAVAVSWWEPNSNVDYRLHVELTGDDYYQCFNSDIGEVMREIPNINNRAGYESGATARPSKGEEYTVKLAAASSTITLDQTNCEDDNNFERELSFTAVFGTPPTPEITLAATSTRTVGTATLASTTATLNSCESGMSTAFYWEEAGKPETQRSHTVAGCGNATCTSNCTLPIGDFIVGNEYELWAVTSNDVGANGPTPRQYWIPSGNPGAPRNVNTYLGGNGILISWDAPNLIPEEGIGGYMLRAAPKTPPACPSALTANPQVIPSHTLHTFVTQVNLANLENHQSYCFQLSAFSTDSSGNETESSRVDFEVIYVDPVTERAGEFHLKWITDPSAKYYTIRWAPLAQDIACANPSSLDLSDPARQPAQFLTETLIYDGEESMSYTIPVIRNIQYQLLFTAILNDSKTYSWSSFACSLPPSP